MIVACGDYKGGCLKYFPMDDGKMAIDLLDEKDSDVRNINCTPFYFDGTKAHGTEPFEGNRYSFVFYCAKKGEQISEDQYSYLKELGFNPPLRQGVNLGEVEVGVARGNGTQEENLVNHDFSKEIQEETTSVDCHAGETLPTMEGIRKHCQFAMESNQSPFTQAGKGLQRRHMKNQGTSHHVLSFDLTGPHPAACGFGFVYGLVGV